MKPIPYSRQHIDEQDIAAVTEALKGDILTQGPWVAEFEKEFAHTVGARYAVAVANGTAALHLAAMGVGAGPGRHVITTPITFAASANCIRYTGGEVEFCDIDPRTYNLSPERVEERLKKNPGKYAGIVAVDFAGHPADLPALRSLAGKYGLWIIEDACHAPGAASEGTPGFRCGDGQFADVSVFSFHPVKHIAAGEGGMLTTNREDIYRRLVLYRSHGITKDPAQFRNPNDGPWYHEMQELGYNYRFTDIQAALALSQLKKLHSGIRRREEIAAIYDREFAGTSLQTPLRAQNVIHSLHLYVVLHERRKELFAHLNADGIFPQIHYIPVPKHPYYQERYGKSPELPVAESYYRRCLSLPLYPSMTEQEISRVAGSVRSFLKKNG